ncbi:AraC family transcriptional regulator [Nocardia farcinica]|uniref:AraC family transcriptional regulator n=1 Tax=Nocardia farcinica TaxID=37329 RepID=UPI001894BD40|nr:AraC family transcriptional regulator [Nocardia farcinica]MBF6359558.1 AraC family transcriptional regulator [Nocardia farcinica]
MPQHTHITATHDWELAHAAVEQVYFPHRLEPLARPDRLGLTMRSLDLGPVTVGRLTWGTEVAIDCEYPGAYEINIPVTGRLVSSAGDEQIWSEPGQATVFHADRRALIETWSADCRVVGVKFAADFLEREAERIHASTVRGRLRLPHQLDFATPERRSWLRLVRTLSAQLNEPAELLANPLVADGLASSLATAFLLAAMPEENDPVGRMRPRTVKRVLDALHEDPARPWTLAEMAELAGSSVRRVQEAFAEHLGTTPTAALRDIRLARAHAELRTGTSRTVADVAARWGFSSPSRFAAAYRRRYGVPPSAAR